MFRPLQAGYALSPLWCSGKLESPLCLAPAALATSPVKYAPGDGRLAVRDWV